jgi:di/tricarboxylate transporter
VSRGLPDRKRNRAALLAILGLIILVLSIGADFFAFGRAEGFGWKQMSGVLCGAVLVLIGAVVRTQTVALAGLILGGLSLLADWLRFGKSPGFGGEQTLGTLLGVILLLVGLSLSFRKR